MWSQPAGMSSAPRSDFRLERWIDPAKLGWYSGDWGGGDDLGREAIRLAVRAYDGRGRPTLLQGAILRALDLSAIDDLVQAIYEKRVTLDDIRNLVPLIFQAANAGDAVARALVERCVEEVVLTAAAMLRRLDIMGTSADIVLAGGVFRTGSSARNMSLLS